MYNFENLTPNNFEELSLEYSKDTYPNYNWVATRQVADFNRDIEAFVKDYNAWSWGEAKHTGKTFKEVSKSRWDPTILSATLKNNVNEVLLITNGWIPLEYIVRVEHFKSKQKILYINAQSLSEWYKNFIISKKHNFPFKIEEFKECSIPQKANTGKIFIYDTKADKLEQCKKIVTNSIYEINIPIFLKTKSEISIDITGNFNVTEIICKKITHKYSEEVLPTSLIFTLLLDDGYSQILVKGFQNQGENNQIVVKITEENEVIASKSFMFSSTIKKDDKNLDSSTFFMNSINRVRETRKNEIICIDAIGDDAVSSDMSIDNFNFNDSHIHNTQMMCRIITFLLSGADISCFESKVIQNTIQNDFLFFNFWISDIFIGVAEPEFAMSALKNHSLKFTLKSLSELSFITKENAIIQIANRNKLSTDLSKILDAVLTMFCTVNSGSLVCLTNKGIDTHNNKYKNEDLVYALSELSEDNIEFILNKAKIFYTKAEFFKALFNFEFIKECSPEFKFAIEDHFAYADCLNHCGSMKESEKQFKQIISTATINDNNENYILEAQTEVFNLKFWQLEVYNLAEDIEFFLDKNKENLLKKTNKDRVNYAYHNCFNRMMVSYYLVGDYEKGEEIYKEYLELKNIPENYKAFIYMDSARGLYAINNEESLNRLNKAYRILEELYNKGKEKRRFLDCKVDLAYISYIKAYEQNENPKLDELFEAVRHIRINGYRNLLLKNYLKLATCLLSKFELEEAKKYIDFVKNNCDFNENSRIEMLYNRVLGSFYLLKSTKLAKGCNLSVDYQVVDSVTFDLNKKDVRILLEARIW